MKIVPFRCLASCAIAILVCTAANAGLTHRYSFNDGTAKDSVGKVDGQLKGSASIADGKIVLKNDTLGSGDAKMSYVEFAGPIMPKADSVSLVVWFTAKDTQGYARLIDIGSSVGGEGQAFLYVSPKTADGNARAAITATDVGGRIFVDGAALDDGKPHMMAIVIDGKAKKLRVYVDGKEHGTAEDLGENTLDKVNQAHTWLGKSSFDVDPGLSASIDEFRVYDHVLTLEEAAAIEKAGPNALPPATPPAR